jgi:thioredoxin reductase/bacterioferritin-associated ferredoxin
MTLPMKSVDVAVLGAGPAGANAAIAARAFGLDVAVIDEAHRAGGQVYRAPNFQPVARDLQDNPDLRTGEALRQKLDESGASLMFGHRLWFASQSLSLSTVSKAGPQWIQARSLIIATGTTERVIPVPGVTLPGVIGLAAATILLKAHATVPGGPVVVAGAGPLLYAVAAGIHRAGGHVAAVVDLLRPVEWAIQLPILASRPDLLGRGFGWLGALKRAGIPIFFGHAVTEIHGDRQTVGATISPVDRTWKPSGRTRQIDASCVAIGHGLTPASETARLVGVPHSFRPERGGFVPEMTSGVSTELPGVYIAGDCAGVSGAAAAVHAGTLAGLTAARDLGALAAGQFDSEAAPVKTRLRWARTFGDTISRLMTLRPGLAQSISQETVVCRCEEVTRSQIERAAMDGTREINQLKSTTRCGMGPCQGRMCGDASRELLAEAGNKSRSDVGVWTARAPLRPLTVDDLVGNYQYEDIPKATPLPG